MIDPGKIEQQKNGPADKFSCPDKCLLIINYIVVFWKDLWHVFFIQPNVLIGNYLTNSNMDIPIQSKQDAEKPVEVNTKQSLYIFIIN